MKMNNLILFKFYIYLYINHNIYFCFKGTLVLIINLSFI